MPGSSEVATPEPETRDEQVNLRLSKLERADLVRRAGELQASLGDEVSLQDYIRFQLWPEGLQVAA